MQENINLKKYNARLLIEEIQKEAYKRGYEKGFEIGAKSEPTKTLGSKYRFKSK